MQNFKIVCPESNSINIIKTETLSTNIACSQCKADLDDPFPLEVTNETCKTNITENDMAISVDFYSSTCGPCMAIYDDYEDAALGFGLKVKFLKMVKKLIA